ncbi:MAG: helix-turn-helix transcriptional regulator, partial [Dehalococcoidia bacterium]
MATVHEDTAAASVLLETKFFAPTWREGLVRRPRLTERLERGVEGRLVLISAPAGSGKTTVLGEWLATRPDRPVAWLSLDGPDSESGRFWEYAVEALQRVRPGIGARALAMLRTRQSPPIEVILTALLNDVALDTNDLVLVLDDYHVIESAPVHEAVSFLIDHMPPQLHLVIASRADPALPLARLRARGELVELRANDLGFSIEEAASFLNEAMGLDLSPEDVAALEGRTEGWIAGLQLAALSMQGRDDTQAFVSAFAGDDRYVVDYLLEEVLQRQPAHVRDFLLATSILDRLCGPLCDA